MRLVDGQVSLLAYHQQRVDRSRRAYFGKSPVFRLQDVLSGLDLPAQGTYKLRLTYATDLVDYEVQPYTIRPVRSLKVVQGDHLRYGRKYADRSGIEALFAQRGACDDILIVQRNHITDASYANLALYDGSRWYTPAWPLLRGTRREYLLQRGMIHSSVIRLRDLVHFESIRLINAMIPWEQGPIVRVTGVTGL
ncbi:hypothetical protein LEM8419_01598 [Neolewinella maritima]|uniref:4-amino-4-deoxychorismate lyase n=2 Tax=Neolewinella maritima TaxID=1383882 RepID=A0ABN8F548_9BACT|nr:hypothetical protein LEM8419_01598 [Neolewinella maritima]